MARNRVRAGARTRYFWRLAWDVGGAAERFRTSSPTPPPLRYRFVVAPDLQPKTSEDQPDRSLLQPDKGADQPDKGGIQPDSPALET